MHLTRLRLDPHNAQARRDLADPYDMHRTLVRAFVSDAREKPPRILWRLEPSQAWDQPVVLVQSLEAGDWAFLSSVPGYLKPANGAVVGKAIDPAALLRPEACLRFRLTANPTVTREGKRLGLVGPDAQLEWLHRQGRRHGFEVQAALVTASDMLRGRKGPMRVTLMRVLFDGVLQVRNPVELASAVATGIGPGKAFGCGLLSLARSA
jgi:CRISPR system Cascade subunit CasE